MKIQTKYDRKSDSVYLLFSDEKIALSKELDRTRIVDYSQDGEIRGIKFLRASTGLNTNDLPHRSAIERALYENGITGINDRLVTDGRKDAGNTVKLSQKEHMKARTKSLVRAGAGILIFIALIVADVLLSRNLFVLHSPLEQVASLFGLTATIFPTVVGSFVLLLFVLDAHSEDTQL